MSAHQTSERPPVVSGPQARFLVLHYSHNVRTLHTIDVDLNTTVEIFGDPDNASYEWLIREHGSVTRHSDCGYGQSAIALRDGLNAFFGGRANTAAANRRDRAARWA